MNISVSSQKLPGSVEGAKRPTAGDEGCEVRAQNLAPLRHPEGGRVPPFIEKSHRSFHLISLGCSKNTVDSEHLIERLVRAGLSFNPTIEDSHVVLINTCGFIKDAKEESLKRIMEIVRLKQDSEKIVVVFGCLVARYHQEILQGIPEIDFMFNFAGENEIKGLITSLKGSPLGSGKNRKESVEVRRVLSPSHYAYLKIADGCDNRCSYCAIPGIRGSFRSFSLESLLSEAQRLVSSGAKELIVVAQDTTRYGSDFSGNVSLVNLAQELSKLQDLKWIRLQYLHPRKLSRKFLDSVFSIPKVLPYFDIPLQHVSDRILKAMNRGVTTGEIEKLILYIREAFPTSIIRSTFIVGFPGETDSEFQELTDFLDAYPLDRVGAFAFSPEEGTPAWKLKPRVWKHLKVRRLDELMTLQQVICMERNKKFLGKIFEVILDRVDSGLAIGRSMGDAPEVDNQIMIKYHGNLKSGEIVRVRITATDVYDYDAELI